jgi:hypothetical protein
MTELEVLDRDVSSLKELLRLAWSDLANPLLTPFEHREARNHINQYGIELRRYLKLIEAERFCRQKQETEAPVSRGFSEIRFRILK